MSYNWNAPMKPSKEFEIRLNHVHTEVLTLELLIQTAPACYTESTDEFFEIDGPILVLIEDVENVICEISWVTEREELFIYPAELCLVELARGTVLEEALVPRIDVSNKGVECDETMPYHCWSSRLSTAGDLINTHVRIHVFGWQYIQ